ncbi:MAG: ATP-binding protein, partial [bacterium]|nr:ATP-binding protein [bacterium]
MPILLPDLFAKKLEQDESLKGPVFTAIAQFDEWFTSNGTPVFFRDYTNHGSKHVESVLFTAAEMVTVLAKGTLSPSDVAILVLSTLLHDSAMHLAEPGFETLIRQSGEETISELDTVSWSNEWERFLFKAKRWTPEKTVDVLGSMSPDLRVTDPFERWGDLTSSDFRLIGEFIRIHHPRLAHEFALRGVPGVEASFLELPKSISTEWKDIAGVVARSHGMPMRKCADYIGLKYHKRDFQGIHATYLMSLLRLSDYLQIQPERAPSVVFSYRVLPSKTSDLEWRVHNCIRNITPQSEDPESVEIQAAPEDVQTYLRVREWLSGIQSELDSSWAVLGETYGRFDGLNVLGLQWRRVRSNIDNVSDFSSTVTYLPRRIRLEVARSELLSLLAKPLYGDDPSFGVRELTQNACDAVRERKHLASGNPRFNVPIRSGLDSEVAISVTPPGADERLGWFEIVDNGIGMTEDVLVNYFLTAGASYRSSGQWQQLFERAELNDSDHTPRSAIPRAGRFGVGVLAAFLIGSEVHIETRHVGAAKGFRCVARLSDDAVQVDEDASLEFGTRIRIPIDATVSSKLESSTPRVSRPAMWEWCVLQYPVVKRYLSSQNASLQNEFSLNLDYWNEAKTDHPMTIHWSFTRSAPRFSCNGIFVSNAKKLPSITERHVDGLLPRTPKIHVFDPDGVLPIGLTRSEITSEEYGFEAELAESISANFVEQLQGMPEQFGIDLLKRINSLQHYAWSEESYDLARGFRPDLVITKEGFAFPSVQTINGIGAKRFLWAKDIYGDSKTLKLITDISKWDAIFIQGTYQPHRHRRGQDSMLTRLAGSFNNFVLSKAAEDE